MKGQDCTACRALYRDNPPCHECGRIEALEPGNILAARLWMECSEHGRQAGQLVGPIDMLTLLNLCEVRGASIEDLDKVLALEKAMLPVLRRNAARAMEVAHAGD